MDPTDKADSLTVPIQNDDGPTIGRSSAVSHGAHPYISSIGDKMEHIDDEQADAWHKQSQPYKLPKPKRKGKRRNDTLLAVFCQWIADHQIGLAVNLLMLLALTHLCFPRARRHTRKFFQLSYHNSLSRKYTIGWDDLPLVFYWIVVFTGLRASVMDYVLEPLAQMAGIDKKKEKVRFAEQAWIFIYYTASWVLGMYLMYNSDYWFNLRNLWTHWPTRDMDGLFKWYYLVQFAFWLQQMIVVNIEERRKDYAQMFTHHVITSALIFTSYGYHQYKIGNMILGLMDPVDILLPIAKMLKYLNIQPACDIVFAAFMVVWLMTRHVFYAMILWSLQTEAPEMIRYGCYQGPTEELQGPSAIPEGFSHLVQPFLDPVGLVCWNGNIARSFMVTLLALQVILLLWFGMVIRVAVKVIRGSEAEDSRSDDEASSEEEDEAEGMAHSEKGTSNGSTGSLPYNEEPSTDSVNLAYQRKVPARKSRKGGPANGVAIASDHKELLGRIGCDKGA